MEKLEMTRTAATISSNMLKRGSDSPTHWSSLEQPDISGACHTALGQPKGQGQSLEPA